MTTDSDYRRDALEDALSVLDAARDGCPLDDEQFAELAYHREDGPAVLWHAWTAGASPSITREALQHAVAAVWSAAEFPGEALGRERWKVLFAGAGFTMDGWQCRRFRKPRRLYRGAVDAARDGWSWTNAPEVAQMFATRGAMGRSASGIVWTVLAPPKSILAVVDPTEGEYIVDTSGLVITRWDGVE